MSCVISIYLPDAWHLYNGLTSPSTNTKGNLKKRSNQLRKPAKQSIYLTGNVRRWGESHRGHLNPSCAKSHLTHGTEHSSAWRILISKVNKTLFDSSLLDYVAINKNTGGTAETKLCPNCHRKFEEQFTTQKAGPPRYWRINPPVLFWNCFVRKNRCLLHYKTAAN